MKATKRYYWLVSIIVVILVIIAMPWYFNKKPSDVIPIGQHGGRLLEQGNVAAEITIVEQGMPPYFRVFIYKNGKPVLPQSARLHMEVKRFSGEVNQFEFKPINDYMQSFEVVKEPHSFIVNVTLTLNKKKYQWNYEVLEGRVSVTPEMIKAASIQTAIAGPRTITQILPVVGKIVPNQDAIIPIYARYPGIVKELRKNLGDSVEKGEIVAAVESNDSLQTYTITTPIAGTVVEKFATMGQMVKGDKPIYEIADLNTVWAYLTLYRKDAPLIQKGIPVTVTGDEGKPTESTTINYVSPLGVENSQTVLARAVLSNKESSWIPGMYVNAVITTMKKNVAVAVPLSALQKWRDRDVVFIQQGNTFEAQPLVLGVRDGHWVEVLEGLKAGQAYVAENSFYLKAELGKSSATHDH